MMDTIDHPGHYAREGYECIDAMRAVFGDEKVAAFCQLNAFKYIWRSDHKNGIEDLKKAVWYIDKYLELKDEKSVL